MATIFLATHPRSMSTALERSFMTRKDLECVHEPFGDPFYFGPEKLSDRYSLEKCQASKYSNTTYADVVGEIRTKEAESSKQGKRVFIKDMAQYLIPPTGVASIAPSFEEVEVPSEDDPVIATNGVSAETEPVSTTPTVLPPDVLHKWKYVFLIRPPHLSIPSYYDKCRPPHSERTGFDHYRPEEAGYRELRLLYDHLVKADDSNNNFSPLIVDASDLQTNPRLVIQRICESVDLPFDESMLSWNDNEPSAVAQFDKWNGWHDDVLDSNGFRIKSKADCEFKVDYDAWEAKWAEKFDAEDVKVIKESVQNSLDDYLYLREYKLTL